MHPILAMAGRMASPDSLRYEIYPAVQMWIDRYMHRSQVVLGEEGHSALSRTVVFMPGLIARHGYYRRISAHLAQEGIHFVPVRGLTRNILPWHDAYRAISDTVKKVEDETGEVPDLLVHSKGGTDSLRVLVEHLEIKQAIFIASPMRGASFGALTSLFSIAGKGMPCTEALNYPEICAKIVTITSRRDRVVLSSEARIDGAKNIIVRGTKTKGHWESHTGLPYFARNHIVRLVQDHKALVAA